MNFNTVIIAGRLTADPELKQAGSSQVCKFRLATNRSWKDSNTGEKREEVCFIHCEAWGKQGETFERFFRKGNSVLIHGRLKLDEWEDKDGNKRSAHKIVLDGWTFTDEKRQNDDSDAEPAPKAEPKSAQGAMGVADEDLPFAPLYGEI